ncbi:MAG TPA: YhcH/YjgK/YiaL family protein [Lacunisphaera sp.]|nr:YhcH/YjgK/YiaL family protein [Lacunisphaera sp.]
MAIFGSPSTVRAQTAATPALQQALDYVEKLLRSDSPERARLFALPAGESVRVELGGGMFAIDAAYLSKPRPGGFFETHRKYIDVQAVLEGEEAMEIADLKRLTLDVPYDAERDLIKYRDYADTSVLRAREGEVMVFFPVDGHMSHAVTRPVLVRKSVVKVPA